MSTYSLNQTGLNDLLSSLPGITPATLNTLETELDALYAKLLPGAVLEVQLVTQPGQTVTVPPGTAIVIDAGTGDNIFATDPIMTIVGSGDDTLHAAAGTN